MRALAVVVVSVAAITAVHTTLAAQRTDVFIESRDHPRIDYSKARSRDPVAILNEALDRGEVQLSFNRDSGYLRSTLDALKISTGSQSLVFSETSAEARLINVRNPRAIYFNDTAAVGWVRGADLLELAAQDPRQGVVFYVLSQQPGKEPRFRRENGCLECHLTWDTLGVPGVMALSTFQMSDDPNAYATGIVVDHRSPLSDRWGGWYVTGKRVPAAHRGNVPVVVPAADLQKAPAPTPQLQSVAGRFDTRGYPTTLSDIVGLMVLEHQTHMTNLLTRLGWEARVAGSLTPRVDGAVRGLVDYLLFIDEAPLAAPIEGSSGFAEEFAARGPRDRRGRSLRDLDLAHRLMRYRCSYMIYTPAFDALPSFARDAAYTRMWQILSGADRDRRYDLLPAVERQSILDILRDTKHDLPAVYSTAHAP